MYITDVVLIIQMLYIMDVFRVTFDCRWWNGRAYLPAGELLLTDFHQITISDACLHTCRSKATATRIRSAKAPAGGAQ